MSDLIKRLEAKVKETKAAYLATDSRTGLSDFSRAAFAYMDAKTALRAELEGEGMIKAEDATKKADALLKAGDALADTFPARSRELLRLCRYYREVATELERKDHG